MKLEQIVLEANVAAKLKDPKTVKMLGIAMRHDSTLPKNKVAALGPKPTDDQILRLWSDLLDDSLRSTQYGDISQDGKFDEWLSRMYINGIVDFEDINGEGGDALGAWKALSIRGRLKEPHQDFNKFKNLRQIQAIIQDRYYRDELNRIKDAEVIEKHKREKKEITIIDNDKFLVTVPFNYGACYTFNNSAGFQASFCTGSSQGLRWFERYSKDGPIISIVDKDNVDDANGKWQMHGPTSQMNNGNQTITYSQGDRKFAELYPGLMKEIIAALKAKGEEIKQASTEIVSGGYDIDKAVADIKSNLPASYASEKEKPEEEPADEPEVNEPDQDNEPDPERDNDPDIPAADVDPEAEADPDNTPGTWLVTQLASGRTARIQGDSLEHVQQRVIQRYPDSAIADYTWERVEGDGQ